MSMLRYFLSPGLRGINIRIGWNDSFVDCHRPVFCDCESCLQMHCPRRGQDHVTDNATAMDAEAETSSVLELAVSKRLKMVVSCSNGILLIALLRD